MASFMGKEEHLVYHGDSSLHDRTDISTTWWGSLPSSILPFLNVAVKKFSAEEVKNQCSKLDVNHPLSKFFTRMIISSLYGSLLHPPVSYLGQFKREETAEPTDNIRLFQYRNADGSDNNILFPDLGKAGFPYAKSVPSHRAVHGSRPAPEDLFDLLMAAESPEKRTESKSGISSLLLYHATLIIHDIFRSNKDDRNVSDTSSYLDLTPLYGRRRSHQEAVRLMQRGLLKPDSFAEERLLMQPPGVCAYLIMYNRFHNYVAEQLLLINENNRFKARDYDTLDKEKQEAHDKKQDEDLFQTARLITTGLYINISIHDYLRVLMGVHTKNTAWTLDPRIEIPARANKAGVQRGVGNQVSAEFNVLYRFHSPISKRDANWTVEFMKDSFAEYIEKGEIQLQQLENGNIPIEPMRRLLQAGYDEAESSLKDGSKPGSKPIPEGIGGRVLSSEGDTPKFRQPVDYKMKRNPDGKFDDGELVQCMISAMEDPICQFGALNQPKAFRTIEILGIMQARKWELATLNEFREFFGLSRHKTFQDINGNPKIQQRLRNLYEDPDMVELYPGLFCEGNGTWVPEDQMTKDQKEPKSSEYYQCNNGLDPGNSCPNSEGTALWRGVFSDAVTLVRSDRFYTVEWNVGGLTAWGMNEVSSDPKILKGGVFHRLFQRAFPGYFNFDSLYLWEPFYTLKRNAKLADEQGLAFDLDIIPKDDMPIPRERDERYTEIHYRKFIDYAPDRDMTVYVPRVTTKRTPTIEVDDYATIKDVILGNKKAHYPFPGIGKSLPKSILRDILTNQDLHDEATALWGNLDFGMDEEKLILEYFFAMSKKVLDERKRFFQGRVRQIDIIRDFVIPIVARFVCDILGCEDHPKTKDEDGRFSENLVYGYISDVQEFLSMNVDEATRWKRRIAFQESLAILKELSEYGIRKAQGGFWSYLTTAIAKIPDDPLPKLKACGIRAARLLLKMKPDPETAAAFMLVSVLDAAHKSVLMFSNILDHLLMPKNKEDWDTVKGIAASGADKKLEHYVLEIQRLAVDLPLIRKFEPKDSKGLPSSQQTGVKGAKPGDILVLRVKQASQGRPFAASPSSTANKVNLNTNPQDYIIYGQTPGDTFNSKRLTILALTGMLKFVAGTGLENLRHAKDEAGHLKRVRTPRGGAESYMTVKWDQLVPFPSTWNLRFDENENDEEKENGTVANGHVH